MGRVTAILLGLACCLQVASAQPATAKDGVRQTIIPKLLFRPHEARAHQELDAIRQAAKRPVVIDGPNFAPLPEEGMLSGYKADGVRLGEVIDVMATSLGFTPYFAYPPDRYLVVNDVPEIALPASDFARVISASTDRNILVLFESRLVMVTGPDVEGYSWQR